MRPSAPSAGRFSSLIDRTRLGFISLRIAPSATLQIRNGPLQIGAAVQTSRCLPTPREGVAGDGARLQSSEAMIVICRWGSN